MKKFCDETLVVSANLHGQIEIEMDYNGQYGYKYLNPDEAISMGSHMLELAATINHTPVEEADNLPRVKGRIISNFFCNGFFGHRYDLEDSEIIGIGDRWMVVRTTSGNTAFADFEDRLQMESYLVKWTSA